jgi:hypothetical protein
MVAVGLSPRTAAKHNIPRRGATAERSTRTVAFNRRCATHGRKTPPPWTEVHGYHHGLAPRGRAGGTPVLHQSAYSAETVVGPQVNTYLCKGASWFTEGTVGLSPEPIRSAEPIIDLT